MERVEIVIESEGGYRRMLTRDQFRGLFVEWWRRQNFTGPRNRLADDWAAGLADSLLDGLAGGVQKGEVGIVEKERSGNWAVNDEPVTRMPEPPKKPEPVDLSKPVGKVRRARLAS